MPSKPDAATGALIAVDWGTSRLRAMLIGLDGRVLTEAESDDGIGALKPGDHEGAFARLVADWPNVPAIIAGMVGSRQGWREAVYVSCPATPETIAGGILRFESAAGRPLAIVPGVMVRSPDRDGDVIRGEETQIVGLLAREPKFDGVVILPGTHSKWATVSGGAVADFQTYLTGEMFGLLAHQSFLRHSVKEGGKDLSTLPDFELGIRRTVIEGLPFLAAIFSVRARQLLDGTAPEDNLAYLSGLVIGGEIAAARDTGRLWQGRALRIVGSRSLARAYARAFDIAGYEAEALDGADLVVAGLLRLARIADLFPAEAPR
jgi:2-dehydro-3-deoxygalactonokinase